MMSFWLDEVQCFGADTEKVEDLWNYVSVDWKADHRRMALICNLGIAPYVSLLHLDNDLNQIVPLQDFLSNARK